MSFRFGLQKYIDHPADPLTVFHDENVVIIQDAFPKALRHYLILPRLPSLTQLHPLDVFSLVPPAYTMLTPYVEQAKSIIVDSLVSDGYLPDNDKDKASFRNKFIRAGVHSIPSMANLHVHVITQDFCLARMKNKKHYNSFTTPFFVDFDALEPQPASEPASESDQSDDSWSDDDSRHHSVMRFERRHDVLHQMIRNTPLTCTYCGAQFGLRFALLKVHLGAEYDVKFPGKARPT